MPDKPVQQSAPLSDLEVQDVLHRMAFELQSLTGLTTRGETAIRVGHKVLLNLTAALIAANDPERSTVPL